MSVSLRSSFLRDAREALAALPASPLVTDADLAPLPPLVATYLRRARVVGRPRVRSFHATFHAQMRSGPQAPWMTATADQYERFDPTARLFFMKARRGLVPFVVYHRYVGSEATMRVRLAGLVPIVTLGGDEATRSETVTLLNDICVLAPAALIDTPVAWTAVDDRHVRATYANAGHCVSAVLTFDAAGDLVDFLSDDRSMAEGNTLRRLPWTTPLRDYRDFGGARLAAHGDAQWTDGGTTWAYGRFELQRITYNVFAPER